MTRRMTRRMRGGLSELEEAIATFTAANTAYDPNNNTTKDTFVEALNTFIGKLIAVRDKLRPPLQQQQLGEDKSDEERASEPSPPTPPDPPSMPGGGGSGGRRPRKSRRPKRSRRSRRRH